jgi:hypothetical protein
MQTRLKKNFWNGTTRSRARERERQRDKEKEKERQEEVVRARAGEREREGERCERLCRFVCCNGKKYGDFLGDFGDGKS